MAGTAAAVAGIISAGASLAGTTVGAMTSSDGYSVACGIETENWTKYILAKPMTNNDGGLIKTPPSEVLPGQREAMVAHKSGGTATGTYGSVSWIIKDRRVVVMWSVPFNHDYYQNWLAVGLTKPGCTQHMDDWFNTMYYKDNAHHLSFKRKKFYEDSDIVSFSDGEFRVQGNMGSTHITTVNIEVKPCNEADYAPPVKKAMGKQ